MAGVPAWSAPRSGLLGDTGAVDKSAQVDQFLGTHPSTEVYQGAAVLTPNGAGLGGSNPATFWANRFDAFDFDQPFTMSGTTIGRVTVPVLPVGNGADLIVSLCADSSGNPGTALATTRIPASWITSLAQVAAAPGPDTAVQLVATPGPLAVPQFNALMLSGGAGVAWASPASSGMGAASNPSSTTGGNYFIQIGGLISGTPVNNVFTINWQGGNVLAAAVPQPLLPQATYIPTVIATPDTLVCAGGQPGATASTVNANVYTAGWNPTTGEVSSWSQQASLPQALYAAYADAWGETVYVAGGLNPSNVPVNTVYWATVSNGQILAWNTAAPLPTAVGAPFVAALGGLLIIAGGYTSAFGATTSAVYYAAINADGSLGPWQPGPSMPTGCAQVGNDLVATTSGLVVIGGYTGSVYSTAIQSLTVGTTGLDSWQLLTSAATADSGIFPVGPGQSRVFSITPSTSNYLTADAYTVPRISVPLPVSGLTNGATYHLTLRQVGGDLNNYLRGTTEANAFPGNPTILLRAKGAGTWTSGTGGYAYPVSIYDQTVSGQPWHTWEDSGARISTLVYATTPDVRLIGVLDAVAQPGPVLNQNWTFTAGTAPWAATGGAITQSSAHVQGGLPFSALLTPTGSAASSFIESEQVAVQQGHSYTATAWLYSPPGYSSVAVNINWYKSDHTALSTTSGAVTALAAATWTQLSTTGAAPVNAAYATIVPVETGTPANTKLLYVSAATLQDASGPMLATVSEVTYPGTWPGTVWPPTGVTQLA